MGRLDYADWKEASDELESMADSRLATDAQGMPVILRSYRVIPGEGGHSGKWCVVETERWLTVSGDVAKVVRTVHTVHDSKADADAAATLARA